MSQRKIVECVPNVSEGRDPGVLEKLSAVIRSVSEVLLLDMDPGKDTHRTVFTFAGPPGPVAEAAFRLVETAVHAIDMRIHRGTHPRMGAVDVLPFVPISGVDMSELVQLSREVGERIGSELGVPVYLYEAAASKPERQSLSVIRQGEYEGLREKMARPEWRPDFGPTEFNPRSGATVVGAREILIAWNINLNTTEKALAHEIACAVREQGKTVKSVDGVPTQVPGRLKSVKAIGWTIPEYRLAQVSINQLNYRVTPLHETFEAVTEEASRRGVRVLGAELVGLVPKAALLAAGRYYFERQNRSSGLPESDLLHMAVRSLGLDTLVPFDPKKKIVDFRVEEEQKKLTHQTVEAFCDEISRPSPAPGGGSVAAAIAAMGASLGSMVAHLSIPKTVEPALLKSLTGFAAQFQSLKSTFLGLIDEDTDAFNAVLAARRLPKREPAEQAARDQAIESANQRAASVPYRTLAECKALITALLQLRPSTNPNCISDLRVAGQAALAAGRGACANVEINLSALTDTAFARELRVGSERMRKSIEEKVTTLEASVARP